MVQSAGGHTAVDDYAAQDAVEDHLYADVFDVYDAADADANGNAVNHTRSDGDARNDCESDYAYADCAVVYDCATGYDCAAIYDCATGYDCATIHTGIDRNGGPINKIIKKAAFSWPLYYRSL